MNVLLFLKIVTKWREIQKSRLNNSLANLFFKKIFTFVPISSRSSKLFFCFASSLNLNFAVNLSREPVKLM